MNPLPESSPLSSISLIENIRARPCMYIGVANSKGLRFLVRDLAGEVSKAPNADIRKVQILVGKEPDLILEFHGDVPIRTPAELTRVLNGPYNEFLTDIPIAIGLSESASVQCSCQGSHWIQHFTAGVAKGGSKELPPLSSSCLRIILKFDRTIFKPDIQQPYLPLCGVIQDVAIFRPKTRFHIADLKDELHRDYYYPNGLESYFQELYTTDKRPYILHHKNSIGRATAVLIDSMPATMEVHSFVNEIPSPENGAHVDGFFRGFLDARRECFPIEHHEEKYLRGTSAILSVDLEKPDWEWGNLHYKLRGKEVESLVYEMITTQLPGQWNDNSQTK